MTKRELLAKNYGDLTPADQRQFDRWLMANGVIGLLFAFGLVAMAINSSGLPGPDTAAAKGADNASVNSPDRANELSAYELMIRLGRELPVRQTADPF